MKATHSGMNNRGMSLVEILVAAGVLSLILLPVALSFSSGAKGIQMTHEEMTAHHAAIELMEQLQSLPFALVPAGNWSHDQIRSGQRLVPSSPVTFQTTPLEGFERRLSVTELSKDGRVRFKKIEITVSWKGSDGKGPARSFSVKGLLANETLQ